MISTQKATLVWSHPSRAPGIASHTNRRGGCAASRARGGGCLARDQSKRTIASGWNRCGGTQSKAWFGSERAQKGRKERTPCPHPSEWSRKRATMDADATHTYVLFPRAHTPRVRLPSRIQYSEKYYDDTYEYRHVVLPPDIAKALPKQRLLQEVSKSCFGCLRCGPFRSFARPDVANASSIHAKLTPISKKTKRAGRVESARRAAVARVDPLRHPQAGAAHHALQAAPQLPAAAERARHGQCKLDRCVMRIAHTHSRRGRDPFLV